MITYLKQGIFHFIEISKTFSLALSLLGTSLLPLTKIDSIAFVYHPTSSVHSYTANAAPISLHNLTYSDHIIVQE